MFIEENLILGKVTNKFEYQGQVQSYYRCIFTQNEISFGTAWLWLWSDNLAHCLEPGISWKNRTHRSWLSFYSGIVQQGLVSNVASLSPCQQSHVASTKLKNLKKHKFSFFWSHSSLSVLLDLRSRSTLLLTCSTRDLGVWAGEWRVCAAGEASDDVTEKWNWEWGDCRWEMEERGGGEGGVCFWKME